MHEWPGQDPTAVRATDLASAAVVVVRFRRRRKATVAAALSVGVAMFVSSHGMFRMTTTSLVPTDPPPTTVPNGVAVTPTPAAEPSPPAGAVSVGLPAWEAPEPSQVPAPAATAPPAPDEPRAEARRRGRSRIPVVRLTKDGSDSLYPCDLNAVPSNPSLCLTSRASQQKSGSVVLTYTACQAQPSLKVATVKFLTAREVDFAIQKDGKIVWQWSTGQRFAVTEHEVLIGTKECVQWRTRWTGLLDDGTRVPPGEYRLRAAGRDHGGMLRLRAHTFVVKF